MSQLDFSLAAGVSARHISFLETGRARPSAEMVMRLGLTLQIPLREQNAMLRAAGMDAAYPESTFAELDDPDIHRALDLMLARHEPWPMLVIDECYEVLRMNSGATSLMSMFIAEPTALTPRVNAMHALFDPRLLRPSIENWEHTARRLLSRLHRESLHRPENEALTALVDQLLTYDGVPASWREPDFAFGTEATLTLTVARDGRRASFLTTVTAFNAPQNVVVEELRIESYYPLDAATEALCETVCATGGE